MANTVDSFLTKIDNSKAVLIVLGDILPASMAFWVPLLVSSLKDRNKTATVIVSDEGTGWSKHADTFFPIDMILDIEPLRQNITIPLAGESESLGEVSYEVVDGNLEVSVVPEDGILSLDKIQTSNFGIKYDLIVGIGIGPHYPALERVLSSKTAILAADAVFIGTPLQRSSFSKILPFISDIEVISEGVDRFLLGATQNFILEDGAIASSSVQKMINTFAFLYTYDRERYIAPNTCNEVCTIIQNISAVDETIKESAGVFSLDGREESIVSEFLAVMKEYSENNFKYFGLNMVQLDEKGISLQDAIVASQHIPLAQYKSNSVLVVEESETIHYLIVKGSAAFVRKVALKYGLAMTDHTAVGRALDVRSLKLEADILRLATNGQEKVLKTAHIESSSPAVVEAIPVINQDKSTVETEAALIVEPVQEDIIEENQVVNETPQIENSNSRNMNPPLKPAKKIKKSALDFGEIAKKMRESISS